MPATSPRSEPIAAEREPPNRRVIKAGKKLSPMVTTTVIAAHIQRKVGVKFPYPLHCNNNKPM